MNSSSQWSAQTLLQASGAYWQGCALQAAVLLDVFTHLDGAATNVDSLAETLGCDKRAFGMLVTALTAMDLVERGEQGMLSAPESVLRYLSRKSDQYIGFIITHHANIMPAWARLAESVRTGKRTGVNSSHVAENAEGQAEREAFLMGMFNIARLQAGTVADAFVEQGFLAGPQKLLDIGGGPGTYAIYFCLRSPELCATVFDLPTTRPFAEKTIARHELSGRISFTAGTFEDGTFPKGQDIAWLSQVLHGESPEKALALVQKAAASLNPGGLLCIQEFMLDDDTTGPLHASLFSLNMLVQTEGGQAYSRSALSKMLQEAGAETVEELSARLPQDCRVLIGRMPN